MEDTDACSLPPHVPVVHGRVFWSQTYHAVAESHDLADSHFRTDQDHRLQIAILPKNRLAILVKSDCGNHRHN